MLQFSSSSSSSSCSSSSSPVSSGFSSVFFGLPRPRDEVVVPFGGPCCKFNNFLVRINKNCTSLRKLSRFFAMYPFLRSSVVYLLLVRSLGSTPSFFNRSRWCVVLVVRFRGTYRVILFRGGPTPLFRLLNSVLVRLSRPAPLLFLLLHHGRIVVRHIYCPVSL